VGEGNCRGGVERLSDAKVPPRWTGSVLQKDILIREKEKKWGAGKVEDWIVFRKDLSAWGRGRAKGAGGFGTEKRERERAVSTVESS